MRAAPLLLACSLAACAAPEAVESAASPIVGGTPDTGDPAVVMLVSYPADLSTFDACTASLIAPKVLLTAAHCLDPAKHPDYEFGVFTGPDATAFPTAPLLTPHLLPIAAVHVHPDYDPSPPFTADIGVAILEEELAAAPLPVNRAPLAAELAGEPARIVGYGQIKYGELHAEKRQAATVVASLGADDTVVVGDLMHRSCVGDSGGPALVKIGGAESIVGVDSYTEISGCLEPAHYRRPDRYTEFLDIHAPPPPPPMTMDAGSGGGGAGAGGEAPATTMPAASGSCAVAGGSSTGAGWLSLLLFAVSLRRRKKR